MYYGRWASMTLYLTNNIDFFLEMKVKWITFLSVFSILKLISFLVSIWIWPSLAQSIKLLYVSAGVETELHDEPE